jgi:hypothetical protein
MGSSQSQFFPFPTQGKHWDRDKYVFIVTMVTNSILKVTKRHMYEFKNLDTLNASNYHEQHNCSSNGNADVSARYSTICNNIVLNDILHPEQREISRADGLYKIQRN